jgi:hypothetical protein
MREVGQSYGAFAKKSRRIVSVNKTRPFPKPDSTSLETCQYFFPNQIVPFRKLVSTFLKQDSIFLHVNNKKTETTNRVASVLIQEKILFLVFVEFDLVQNVLELPARGEARQHTTDLVGTHLF